MTKTVRDMLSGLEQRMRQTTIGELKRQGYDVLLTDEQTEKLVSATVSDLEFAKALEPIASIVVRTFLDGLRAISLANDILKRTSKEGAFDNLEFGPLLTPRDGSTAGGS